MRNHSFKETKFKFEDCGKFEEFVQAVETNLSTLKKSLVEKDRVIDICIERYF